MKKGYIHLFYDENLDSEATKDFKPAFLSWCSGLLLQWE